MFAADETSKIIEAVRSKAKAAGKVGLIMTFAFHLHLLLGIIVDNLIQIDHVQLETKDGIYSHFVELCRENLHCVLAFR